LDSTPDIGVDALTPDGDAETPESRSLSRRKMIKAAAITGAAAWTAPVIIDSIASPAAAVTCPAGKYQYLVLWSGTLTATALSDRQGGTDNIGGSAPGPGGTCDWTAPESTCLHSNAAATYSTLAASGLTIASSPSGSNINIAHNVSSLAQGAIKITVPSTSCCNITSVKAHVHRYGAPTGNATTGDCPPVYCQQATSGGTYLQITAGAYLTKTVTVQPVTTNACTLPSNEVHWGSPNQDAACQTSGMAGNGYTNGQPFGYMLIELDCTGPV